MEEIWKPIGIEKYMISNFGNVKGKNGEKPLKPQIIGNGHFQVSIAENGVRKFILVHRLVGQHFLEKPTADKCLIDHIDRNKINNHVSNLRWVSHQENCNNRFDSREPTEKVLKQREYQRNYRLENVDRYKALQAKYVQNGQKSKLMEADRNVSKELLKNQN